MMASACLHWPVHATGGCVPLGRRSLGINEVEIVRGEQWLLSVGPRYSCFHTCRRKGNKRRACRARAKPAWQSRGADLPFCIRKGLQPSPADDARLH